MDLNENLEQLDVARTFNHRDTEWNLKCYNPYGFWKISQNSGPVPEVLRGVYTSYIVAEQAIEKYVNAGVKKVEDKAARIEKAIHTNARYKPTRKEEPVV